MTRQGSPIEKLCEEAAAFAVGTAVLSVQRAKVAARASAEEPAPTRAARVAAALAEPAVAPLRTILGRACGRAPAAGR